MEINSSNEANSNDFAKILRSESLGQILVFKTKGEDEDGEDCYEIRIIFWTDDIEVKMELGGYPWTDEGETAANRALESLSVSELEKHLEPMLKLFSFPQ
ncbi:MAG: hypothetical protein DHS20C12_11640 [Pseudohongiella sp.]|nr:MAG: hypothetical protein DHS20C12_11640 [Pseudohongiella sp.]